jgi:hypothetical protein
MQKKANVGMTILKFALIGGAIAAGLGFGLPLLLGTAPATIGGWLAAHAMTMVIGMTAGFGLLGGVGASVQNKQVEKANQPSYTLAVKGGPAPALQVGSPAMQQAPETGKSFVQGEMQRRASVEAAQGVRTV